MFLALRAVWSPVMTIHTLLWQCKRSCRQYIHKHM